ncbi:MAG: hypothetical protein ACUVTO_03890 [Candidatus Caldatribacteriaceae bacterium]
MRKLMVVLGVVLVLFGLVTLVGGAQELAFERGETFYMSGAAWGPPSTWNPFMPWLHANTTGTIGFVYETLFLYNPLTDEFIPWLAESGKWLDAET